MTLRPPTSSLAARRSDALPGGPHSGPRAGEHGMTVLELVVSMAIMSLVMAGVFGTMAQATRANEAVKLTTSMNNNLRVAIDLLVRDAIQAGQGLPAGKVVAIPSGPSALAVIRPGPIGTAYTFGPAAPSLPAVTVGAGAGPAINGQATDMITLLAADNVLSQVELTALTAASMRLSPDIDNTDVPDVNGDNIRVGDLIMLTKQSISVLKYVTAVNGDEILFENGDPLNLNQIGAEEGTLAQYVAAAPVETPACPPAPRGCGFQIVPSVATRIRMISYYLETPGNDGRDLRLVRRINANPPTAVAFAIERFSLTYDLVDGVTNPVNIAMDNIDLAGAGGCTPDACSVNQIRKVNIMLTGRSSQRHSQTRQFFRNTLTTQVSLRNLSLVDRYR